MLIFLSLLLAALASPRRVESDPKFYIHDFGRPEAVDLYPPLHAKLLPFTNASDMIFSEKYAANEGFGEYDLHTRTFSTWQVALFRNVYSRLARSRRRTRAAAAASLFFIPYDAGVETYIYRDGTFRGGGNPLAKVISKYLNSSAVFKRRYGADHFMIYSASLLSQGISSKLKRLFRICANVTIFTFETYEASGQKKFQGFNLPHLTAVPYPSIYHWNEREGDRSLPVLRGGRGGSRPLFSSLLASTLTNQPDSNKLRRLLMQQCRDADTRRSDLYERLCWYHDIGSRDQRNNFNVSAVGEVYGASVFCLMPPGDTNTRRGIFDAVLCGCIPVLFEYPGSPKPVNPIRQYHWHFSAEEMENGFVFFNGSDTNYFEILSSISAEEIQKRQSYLRRVAFKTQYSLPSPILARPRAASRALPPVQEVLEPWEPPESDAADVILDTLFGMVRSRPEQID